MSEAPQIMPIQPHQLDGLLDLCREHAAYEGVPFADSGQVVRWRDAFFSDRPQAYGWLANDGDRLCGFMTVTIDFSTWSAAPFAHMDCLYLREEFRGVGLGGRFLSTLRIFAEQHGCRWAEWQTPPDNHMGIGFYDHAGATAKDKRRYAYTIGASSQS